MLRRYRLKRSPASLTRIPLILLAFAIVLPAADKTDYEGSELIDRYRAALASQEDALKNVAMEVHMEGRIPKLKKEGKMSAMRMISSLGKVTYKMLGFWGD